MAFQVAPLSFFIRCGHCGYVLPVINGLVVFGSSWHGTPEKFMSFHGSRRGCKGHAYTVGTAEEFGLK